MKIGIWIYFTLCFLITFPVYGRPGLKKAGEFVAMSRKTSVFAIDTLATEDANITPAIKIYT